MVEGSGHQHQTLDTIARLGAQVLPALRRHPPTLTPPREHASCTGAGSSRLLTSWAAVGEVGSQSRLVEFYRHSAGHWIHVRTTNPIWVSRIYFRDGASAHQRSPKAPGLAPPAWRWPTS
jgi:hypothetical protein